MEQVLLICFYHQIKDLKAEAGTYKDVRKKTITKYLQINFSAEKSKEWGFPLLFDRKADVLTSGPSAPYFQYDKTTDLYSLKPLNYDLYHKTIQK